MCSLRLLREPQHKSRNVNIFINYLPSSASGNVICPPPSHALGVDQDDLNFSPSHSDGAKRLKNLCRIITSL